MKKLNALLFVSLISLQISGQALPLSEFNPKFWEVGWVSSDIFIGAFSADVVLGFRENQGIGLRTTFTQDYFPDDFYGLYDNSNFIYRGGIFHKIYLADKRNRHITLRHGPRISVSEYSFQKEGWIEFYNSGNRQYRFGTINLTDQNIELGYEFIVGIQQRYNSMFFLEYYLGVSYMDYVSTNSTEYTLNDLRSNDYSYGYYSEFLPNQFQLLLGFVIGLRK